jgi:hypothetical protein
VKGPCEECESRLTCGSKRLLLYVRGERGTIVPYGLHTIADVTAPHNGWHTIVVALVELTGIFLLPSFCQDVQQTCLLLVPLLAERGQCASGDGDNDVHLLLSDDNSSVQILLQQWL